MNCVNLICHFISVVTFGYNPTSYSFSEDSGSNDVSVAVIRGNPGQFQLSAQYQTMDTGTALGIIMHA